MPSHALPPRSTIRNAAGSAPRASIPAAHDQDRGLHPGRVWREALDGVLNQLAAEQKPQEAAELLERLRAFDYDTTLAADAEQLGASDDDEHDDDDASQSKLD